MAALYGTLTNEKAKPVTRTSADYLVSKLETWEGKVEVTLWADGRFTVEVGDKYEGGFGMLPVVNGNINSESGRREAAGTYDEL